MTINDLVKALDLKVISGAAGLQNSVDGAYVSDLLSDVMGFAEMGQLWITLQTHKNIMAIASLKELSAVILIKGFMPDEDTLKQSDEEGIPILSTKDACFEIAGKLYKILHEGL